MRPPTSSAVRTALAAVLAAVLLAACEITITPGASYERPTDVADLRTATPFDAELLSDGETASWDVRISRFDGDQVVFMTDGDVLRVRDAGGRVIASSFAANRFVEGDVVRFAVPVITVESTDPGAWRCEAGPCVAVPAPDVPEVVTVEVERSGFGSAWTDVYAAGMAFYDPAEPTNDPPDGAVRLRNDAVAAHAIETIGDVDRFWVDEQGWYDVAPAFDLDLRVTVRGGGEALDYRLEAGDPPGSVYLFAGDTVVVEADDAERAATADGSAYEIAHPAQSSERLQPE